MSTRYNPGLLYIVATPIGNLEDISHRAERILSEVDLVAAEDTRHTTQLLSALNIRNNMISLHEHNEQQRTEQLLMKLQAGQTIALVSDAGTPLISDPGFVIVRACREAGIRVIPVPGPSAVITALSAAGLPSDRFLFEGFLPRNSSKRKARLEKLRYQTSTLICYESSHRLLKSLQDMSEVLGRQRLVVVARELTKKFETILDGPLEQVCENVANDANQQRGEMVVLVAGYQGDEAEEVTISIDQLLRVALEELSPSQAAALVARLTPQRKKVLYQRAMALKEASDN